MPAPSAPKDDSGFQYVPVRRTAIFIEQSIYGGIQWAVFEPNDETLWGGLQLNIGSFMLVLFRAGAFLGETASEAFFVRCDATTNPPDLVKQGIVTALVGFAPLQPAEFVLIRRDAGHRRGGEQRLTGPQRAMREGASVGWGPAISTRPHQRRGPRCQIAEQGSLRWGDLPRRSWSPVHLQSPRPARGQLGIAQSLGGVGSSADNAALRGSRESSMDWASPIGPRS